MGRDVRGRLLRLGAILTMATGLLFFGFGLTPFLLLPTEASLLEWVQDPQWSLGLAGDQQEGPFQVVLERAAGEQQVGRL